MVDPPTPEPTAPEPGDAPGDGAEPSRERVGAPSDRVVTFGEIMLRLSPPGMARLGQTDRLDQTFGGAEASVAASLARFGHIADYVTRLPANELGDAAIAYLRALGVGTGHVVRGGDRLGIYFYELGAAQRPSQVLYDRAGSAMATIEPGMVDWDAILAGARWFHTSGITPAISRGAAATALEAVRAARRAGATVSIDINYRAKLWAWGESAGTVMSDLVAEADLLFGNEEDADKVFGIRGTSTSVETGRVVPAEYQGVCERLAARFPDLRVVALTLRGSFSASHNSWSGVAWERGAFHVAPTYDITPIVDRLGAGDAFAAGIIHGLMAGETDAQTALEFAVAAACLKHSLPGDANRVSLADVEALAAGNASGRVAR